MASARDTKRCREPVEVEAKCAALLYVTSTDALAESIASFCAPEEVSGLFIVASEAEPVGLGDVRDALAQEGLRSATARCSVKAVVQQPADATMGACFNRLREQALEHGFTHALVGRTHEVLKRLEDSQRCEALPDAWAEADVLQCASGVSWRPTCDVFVRLSMFTFVGAAFPVPIPASEACAADMPVCHDVWDGVSVGTLAAWAVPRQTCLEWARAVLHAAETTARVAEAGALTFQGGQLLHAAGRLDDAAQVFARHTDGAGDSTCADAAVSACPLLDESDDSDERWPSNESSPRAAAAPVQTEMPVVPAAPWTWQAWGGTEARYVVDTQLAALSRERMQHDAPGVLRQVLQCAELGLELHRLEGAQEALTMLSDMGCIRLCAALAEGLLLRGKPDRPASVWMANAWAAEIGIKLAAFQSIVADVRSADGSTGVRGANARRRVQKAMDLLLEVASSPAGKTDERVAAAVGALEVVSPEVKPLFNAFVRAPRRVPSLTVVDDVLGASGSCSRFLEAMLASKSPTHQWLLTLARRAVFGGVSSCAGSPDAYVWYKFGTRPRVLVLPVEHGDEDGHAAPSSIELTVPGDDGRDCDSDGEPVQVAGMVLMAYTNAGAGAGACEPEVTLKYGSRRSDAVALLPDRLAVFAMPTDGFTPLAMYSHCTAAAPVTIVFAQLSVSPGRS